ncbi:hypothetical protein K466DRAFT_570771 [Polyporus arcularius HHB13444]|uniref:HNH nuclease domain-containing protein n=1 Tax=Polyporus arcularius HHB13444 TaxID=1314778 RepID=A0A5C3NPM4_9APHY|nr:hypothetical protein K466DRAFT_570771 [Polyporus arcularius HHB13444]
MGPSATQANHAIRKRYTSEDEALMERAQQHLQVLESPEFAKYNMPQWIGNPLQSQSNSDHARGTTARRLFDAMVQTADELDLGIGRRFPAAEICACALLAENSRALPSCCLAQERSTLIFDIWWTALWWPLADLDVFSLTPVGRIGEETVQKYKDTDRLDIVPIFARPITDPARFSPEKHHKDSQTANTYLSLHLYRTFGRLQHDIMSFRLGKWSLVATQEPNKYKIRTYAPPDRLFGIEHNAERYITFTEPPTADLGTRTSAYSGTLPSPDLLQAHAIFANILDLSGLASMMYPNHWESDVTYQIDNEMRRARCLPHLHGMKPVPNSPHTSLLKTYLPRTLRGDNHGDNKRRETRS